MIFAAVDLHETVWQGWLCIGWQKEACAQVLVPGVPASDSGEREGVNLWWCIQRRIVERSIVQRRSFCPECFGRRSKALPHGQIVSSLALDLVPQNVLVNVSLEHVLAALVGLDNECVAGLAECRRGVFGVDEGVKEHAAVSGQERTEESVATVLECGHVVGHEALQQTHGVGTLQSVQEACGQSAEAVCARKRSCYRGCRPHYYHKYYCNLSIVIYSSIIV